MCPDVPKGFEFMLEGEPALTKSKSVNIKVSKCMGHSNCKNDTEIAKFVDDIEVSTWFIYDKIDFNVFNARPTYKMMDIFTSDLISSFFSHTISTNWVYLKKNTFTTQD